MKIWWILGGLFLLSRKPAPVSTSPGGMTPVESMSDAIGGAVDAVTGQQVNVVGPLPTTVTGQIATGNSFGLDASDEAFSGLPSLDATTATAGPAQVPKFLPNPDTIPGAWPGLPAPTNNVWAAGQKGFGTTAPAPTPTLPAGDPRGTGSMIAAPLFDLTQDDFLVPGFGQEDFSAGVLTPDEKLAVLRANGYTGPDPRQVATTPLAAAQDANPPISPVTGRVALPNV